MWGGVTTRPSGINSVRAVGALRESALKLHERNSIVQVMNRGSTDMATVATSAAFCPSTTATLVPPESTPTSTSAFMTQAPHEPLMKSVHQIVLNPKIISPLQSQTKIASPVPLSMLLTCLVGKKQVTVNQTLPPKWQPISNLKLHKKSMVEKENNHCPIEGHPTGKSLLVVALP
ncbi:hypothetical protein Pelo_18547 [Pelomyxa schiedti]|nr:hypothetical protein Pelo_18547 [Pelomyxa schiedti]